MVNLRDKVITNEINRLPKSKTYYQSKKESCTTNKARFAEIKNFIRQHNDKIKILRNIKMSRPTFEDKNLKQTTSKSNEFKSQLESFIIAFDETIENIKRDVSIVEKAFEKVPAIYLKAVKEHLFYDTRYDLLEAKYYVSVGTIKYYQAEVIREVIKLKGYDKYDTLRAYYN